MIDLLGLAALVGAVLGPTTAVMVALINSRRIKHIEGVTQATLEKATSTDHAVNGKMPRDSTISEDMVEVRDRGRAEDAPPVVPNGGLLTLVTALSEKVDKLIDERER